MRINIQIIKITLSTIILSAFLLNTQAQVTQEIQNRFSSYKQNVLQEKIFVHTDKSVYLPGEIIWFKIYCLNAADHKLLNLSKVAYVDVLDKNQLPVIQAKVVLKDGVGSGSLYIPVTANNGNFLFRTYTSWMKNFSPDYYFEKIITFVNPLRSPDAPAKDIFNAYDVQFFPEGGDLVSGIASKVAFKAVGQNGKGAELSGAIIDQHNDTVVRFASLKFGMGSFSFTPAAGNSYKAIIKINGNNQIIKELPTIKNQGYVMKLTDDGSGQLDIAVNGSSNANGYVYLLTHSAQSANAVEGTALSAGAAHFKINKSTLSDGISHITIFNDAKQPVCERLYFKRPTHQLTIEASIDQQLYNTRKKVNVNISAKDLSGKSLNANLSAAVYRIDSLQSVDYNDIFSYLWLNSDLRGSIESPEYYLKNTAAESDQALDNLMLTQGWRRFKWDDVLAGKPLRFNFLPELTGHQVTAKIVNTTTGAPANGIITYLAIPGKRVQLSTSLSDSTGRLIYNTRSLYGPNELIAQTNTLIDTNYRIDFISPFSEQYSKTVLPNFNFSAGSQTALRDHSLGVQVLNIYSGNNIKRFYDPLIDSSAFYGKPFKSYMLDDFTRFTTMEEDLREYVAEDNILKVKGKFHIKVLTGSGATDGDPLVLFDGIPVFDVDKIFAVDPLKVQKLDVVNQRYTYGPAQTEGIFSFTTYKGDMAGVDLDPHAVVIDYEGLQFQREFYSPVYDTDTKISSRIPDFRNLLYWSPNVYKQGKDAVSFYTSDQKGKYIGVIQGISANGEAGSQYFSFEVK